MVVDWTISVGNVLTLLAMFIGGMAAVMSMRGDIKGIRSDLDRVEKDLDKIATVLIEMARQEERMSAMDRRLTDQNIRLFKIEAPGVPFPSNGNK